MRSASNMAVSDVVADQSYVTFRLMPVLVDTSRPLCVLIMKNFSTGFQFRFPTAFEKKVLKFGTRN